MFNVLAGEPSRDHHKESDATETNAVVGAEAKDATTSNAVEKKGAANTRAKRCLIFHNLLKAVLFILAHLYHCLYLAYAIVTVLLDNFELNESSFRHQIEVSIALTLKLFYFPLFNF